MPIGEVAPEHEFGLTEVIEIKRVAAQGVLRPLVCTCADGQVYIVKPLDSGEWPLCFEWICARLGRKLGLDIPNYRQVSISPELASAWNENLTVRQVQGGIGFGSQLIESAAEVDFKELDQLPVELRQKIIWFDCWIRNCDRRRGNNPNMLWSPGQDKYYLIDHEKAFASDGAGSADFWADHAVASARGTIPQALVDEMKSLLPLLPEIRQELPSAWTTTTDVIDSFLSHLTLSLNGHNFDTWNPQP
jgi:hypothetical protein